MTTDEKTVIARRLTKRKYFGKNSTDEQQADFYDGVMCGLTSKRNAEDLFQDFLKRIQADEPQKGNLRIKYKAYKQGIVASRKWELNNK